MEMPGQKTFQIDGETLIRYARESEVPEILRLIKDIAAYEKMSDQVWATEEILHKTLFEDRRAEVLFCVHRGEIVGFALFFYNFSTFVGRPGLYLEDLFLQPGMRGRGLGRAFFNVLLEIAYEHGCGRMEWVCLNWNRSSIGFYRHLGAVPMDGWTTWRIALRPGPSST